MTIQQLQSDAYDVCAERNRLWQEASNYATRLCNSDFSSEILADFITDLVFGESRDQCDPIQLLHANFEKWDSVEDCDCDFEDLDDEDFV